MNIWDILGIPSTHDEKLIKRAYSQKLKGIDRSIDINGFQQLYEAYERASQLARGYEPREKANNSEVVIQHSPAEDHSTPIKAPEGWHEVNDAMDHFFSSVENFENPRVFVDSYELLMLIPQLVERLYRFELVEDFLKALHILFQEHPIIARQEFLEKVYTDFHFDEDIKLYNQYAHILHLIEAQCAQESFQKLWISRIDPEAAEILLDKASIDRGFKSFRHRNLLAKIIAAIDMLELFFPMLIERAVSREKIVFWRLVDKSLPFTFERLKHASWAIFCVPVYLFGFFNISPKVIGIWIIPLSYFAGLFYQMARHHLQILRRESSTTQGRLHRICSLLEKQSFIHLFLVLNLFIGGMSAFFPSEASHSLAVVGCIGLLLAFPSFGWFMMTIGGLGSLVVLGLLGAPEQQKDLAVACQLGMPLTFYIFMLITRMRSMPSNHESSQRSSSSGWRMAFLAIVILNIIRMIVQYVGGH